MSTPIVVATNWRSSKIWYAKPLLHLFASKLLPTKAFQIILVRAFTLVISRVNGSLSRLSSAFPVIHRQVIHGD